MAKTILIDPKVIRPLPKSMQGIACECCNKTQAVWERTRDRTATKGDPMCSLCWMYETEWGTEYETELREFVTRVEDSMSRLFKKTEDARLARCADADRIMSSVVLTTRMFIAKGVA